MAFAFRPVVQPQLSRCLMCPRLPSVADRTSVVRGRKGGGGEGGGGEVRPPQRIEERPARRGGA
eukprot:1310112-Prymnesium_polylepis.1